MELSTKLYENVKKIYGPYTSKDGRQRVVIVFIDNSKKTISYPKFFMQEYIGRLIEEPETIDHIDGNPLNNTVENLRIVNRSKHVSLDVKRVKAQEFKCGVCGTNFILESSKLNDAVQNRKKGHTGPFCSRSCAGKASHNPEKYSTLIINKEYYTNKSLIKET